jgi:hypothetical protein
MSRINIILIIFFVFFNTQLSNSKARQPHISVNQIIQIQLILDSWHFIIHQLYLDNKMIL